MGGLSSVTQTGIFPPTDSPHRLGSPSVDLAGYDIECILIVVTDARNEQGDAQVQQVLDTLADFKDSHPDAQIDARRQNSVSIRVRIMDPDFEGMDWVDREPPVWKMLRTLPEDIFTNITMLLLIASEEAESSLANLEFNDPIPSRL